jgi:hypothetical protein
MIEIQEYEYCSLEGTMPDPDNADTEFNFENTEASTS